MTAARRLHLLRHAKSSWDDPTLADHDRPLAPRGRKAAARIAAWADETDVRPSLVLCSTALRARETLERVLPALDGPEVRFDERLYHAAPDALLELVRAEPHEVGELMLVGHNPGLGALCALLARPGELRTRAAGRFPTGALATLDLDAARWRDAAPAGAELAWLVYPRELSGGGSTG